MTFLHASPSEEDALYYTTTPDDIHIFQVTQLHRAVIDEWFSIIVPLYKDMPSFGTLRICVDVRVHELAHLTYAFQRWRVLSREFAGNMPSARYAVLHAPQLNMVMLDSMLSLTARNNAFVLRYFHSNGYEAAAAWLLNSTK